jgi:hypothetical protein
MYCLFILVVCKVGEVFLGYRKIKKGLKYQPFFNGGGHFYNKLNIPKG